MNIIADPLGRVNHWIVDGQLFAGPRSESEVKAMLAEMQSPAVAAHERAVPVRIAKLTLIDRLTGVGLFDLAMTTIKSSDLTYERWQASASVDSSNPDVRALLTAIGGNLDELLAPE